MKKLLYLIVVLFFAVSLLVSCNDESPEDVVYETVLHEHTPVKDAVNLKNTEIPESIKKIADKCFYECITKF